MAEELKYVECPHCKKPVPEDALRCIYCEEMLDVRVGFLSNLSSLQKGALISVVAVVLTAAFLLWLLYG